MTPVLWDLAPWAALLAVVVAVASGYRRFELVAALVLLLLGVCGFAPPAALFAGFGHPALVTIVSLYVSSQGITDAGVLEGLGLMLERRLRAPHRQVLGLCLVTALLSAVMNNVGALALIMPTAARMAKRAGISPGYFGIPLTWAAILGGTLTLAGSAPNIIVSSFRSTATGAPYRMFDFAPHGLAICATGIGLWFLTRTGRGKHSSDQVRRAATAFQGKDSVEVTFAPLATPRRRLCIGILTTAVAAVSLGWLPPSLGFSLGAVLMVLAGVVDAEAAYRAIDLRVVLFLGSMLGLGRVLEDSGALASLVSRVEPAILTMGGTALLGVLFAAAVLVSNVLNNAAAAVLLAPLAINIAAAGAGPSLDALLMAVGAGACLALILPTHQVALMAMSGLPYDVRAFSRGGLLLTLVVGMAAVFAISLVWR